MRTPVIFIAMGAGLMLLSAIGHAAAPANAPAGSTGLCNDGTFYSGPRKQGACKGHKGLKKWYGAPAAATTAAPATTAPAPHVAAGPGGVAVWTDNSTKAYHCPGDKLYGKTKQGEYMPEAVAATRGFKPDQGKACK